jgi:hypothetical protein
LSSECLFSHFEFQYEDDRADNYHRIDSPAHAWDAELEICSPCVVSKRSLKNLGLFQPCVTLGRVRSKEF